MIRWWLLALCASCVSSNSVECDFGLCPEHFACDAMHHLCVDPAQLTACTGLGAGVECAAGDITGHCVDAVCLPTVCSDGVVEPGEQCDDANVLGRDGCSADCTSTEVCGNGVVDLAFGETCDDGNFLDHDGCSSACQTEQPHWVQHTLFPPARSGAGFAYDSVRDRIVVMGGVPSSSTAFSDTWEWDGGEWTQSSTVGPSARAEMSMAFDAARKEVLLFGGYAGFSVESDTWLWNGSTWRLAHPMTNPKPRGIAAMAYDSHRQRTVMFGGTTFDTDGQQSMLDDTWEWDGSNWKQVTTAHKPPVREFGAMTYDPKRGVVVLAGGFVPAIGTFTDTWEYDGVDWTMKSNSAPAIARGALTYDPVGARTLFYGGNVTTVSAWNGTSWSTVTTSGTVPTAREEEVFVATKSRVVLFGGDRMVGGQTNETWFLTNNAWSQPTDLGVRVNAVAGTDALLGQQIVYGGQIAAAPTVLTGETWARTQAGWTLRASAPPSARVGACLAYDYAHHNFVMFGGLIGSTPTNETWVWEGAGWTQKFPAASPPARAGGACAFDSQHVTMVGGVAAGNIEIADAWSWDGSNWSTVALPNGFIARGLATAAYDPKHHHLALFSGLAASVSLIPGDTWLFDGTTWTEVATEGFRPAARFSGAMAWNPARQTLVLTGGSLAYDHLDAYELDDKQWNFIPATNQPPQRQSHVSMSTIDGSGITIASGKDPVFSTLLTDRWDLRWDSSSGSDRCNAKDGDGDGRAACDDADCWWVCTPLCPPFTTCDPAAPTCGDGTCSAPREDCHTCAADCTCGAPVCGDGYCDAGETCPGDCP